MFKKITIEEQIRKERGQNLVNINNQAELAKNISEQEIQEVIQGRQLSNLEIEFLKLQEGGK